MLYFILFLIMAAGIYYGGKEERQNEREKKEQNSLWRLASIKEKIEKSSFYAK